MQYGALPYRLGESGALEFLLVTTRESGRWIIPKGGPIKGLKPSKSAAQEAFEEAGIRGTIGAKPLGVFTFDKNMRETGLTVPCEVRVYPLPVKRQYKIYPEVSERMARWFNAQDTLDALKDAGLREIIELFVARLTARRKPAKRQRRRISAA